jgi:ATP-dependent RNA helicase DDX54/DBP10
VQLTYLQLPYLLDLQLFLGRRLLIGSTASSPDYSSDIILGCFPPDTLDIDIEWVKSRILGNNNLESLQQVANNGYKLYTKSKLPASSESHARSKQLYTTNLTSNIHLLFGVLRLVFFSFLLCARTRQSVVSLGKLI